MKDLADRLDQLLDDARRCANEADFEGVLFLCRKASQVARVLRDEFDSSLPPTTPEPATLPPAGSGAGLVVCGSCAVAHPEDENHRCPEGGA